MTHTFLKAASLGIAALAGPAWSLPAAAQVTQSGDIVTITTSSTPDAGGSGAFLVNKSTTLTNPLAGELCIGAVFGTCASGTPTAPILGPGAVSVDSGSTLTVNRHVNTVCSVDGGGVSGITCNTPVVPFSGARIFVGVSEVGTLNVSTGGHVVINGGTSPDGGSLSISDRLGQGPHGTSATGTVNVDGAGSSIAVSGTNGFGGVTVGRDGTGHLNVTNGGSVQATSGGYGITVGGQNFVAGNSTELGTGFATVANAGSSITGGSIFVGRSAYGTGTLTLDDHATASTTSGIVGIGYDGGTGAAEVKNGAQLTSATSIFVGRFTGSSGMLDVHDGGTLNIGTGSSLLVGSEGGNGAVHMSNGGTINGTNTTLLVGRSQDAGLTGGVGTADVQDSTINARTLIIGSDAGSNGAMTVDGTTAINLSDATTTGAALLIGRDGTGSLTMTGGQITINAPTAAASNVIHGMVIGGASNAVTNDGVGTLDMSGAGTKITMQTGGVIVGRQGHGTMNLSAGAQIDGSTESLSSFVGRSVTGVGTVDMTGPGTAWNAGTHGLYIGTDHDFVNNVDVAGGQGLVRVSNGATLTADHVVVGQGGTLTGNGGIVQGNVTNYGTLAPGNSPGSMTIIGDLTLDDLGTTALELGGAAPGQYDHVDVTGNLALDGTLDVSLYGGYMPTIGSFFDVFTALDVMVGTPIFDFQYVEGISWSYEIVAGDGNESVRILANAAPEPVTIALFGAGLGGLAFTRRRRRVAT